MEENKNNMEENQNNQNNEISAVQQPIFIKIKEKFRRTVVKTLIWRVIAITSTTILALFLYNDLEKATKLGIIDNVIKLFIHFIFERIWSKILWGMKEVPVEDENEQNVNENI